MKCKTVLISSALFITIGGLISGIAGLIINGNSISVGLSILSGKTANPGTAWIIIGLICVISGVITLTAFGFYNRSKSEKNGEIRMISGIIALIVIGFMFIAGGGILICIGIQINNAFNHAWDLFISYLSFASAGPDSGNVFIIIGSAAGALGICFMIIGILEAVKITKKKPNSQGGM